ncbi:MAG: flagellar motor protein MotB [Thiomicrorhabdus sp.]|jgi:chemotaxis protein MotB|nr:flagellar motor protein MotB [Thiomicrorhabdus sp.]
MSRRRRGGHGGGAHGGSWKIALADLMTVLMVFFLVMWLMAVVEPEDRKAFVDGIGGGLQPKASEIEPDQKVPAQEELIQLDLKPPVSKEDIEEAMKEVNPKDINIEETPEFTRITLKSDSFFESARATISDTTREQLEQLGETFAGREQEMVIAGYTDDRPINNFQFPSNWELSAARAATVARTFIYMGVDKNLVRIEGNADNAEVAPNNTAYGRSLNRRVIITIKKDPPKSP